MAFPRKSFIEQNTEIFDVAPLCSKLTPLFGQMSRVNPNIIILLNRLEYLTYRDILCSKEITRLNKAQLERVTK